MGIYDLRERLFRYLVDMNTPNGFYINLDRRTDRREQMEKEMNQMGFTLERFSAISHKIPALGCSLSHIAVLREAQKRDYESVLILEDDFEFLISKEEFQLILENLPSDFDVVMLGYYIVESEPYNETFGKVLQATTTSGYIVHKRFYSTLLKTVEEGTNLFEENQNEHDAVSKYIIDQFWKKIQKEARWYYTLKRVGKQRSGYSDLVGEIVNYDY